MVIRGVLDWDLRFRYMWLYMVFYVLFGVVWIGWQVDVIGSYIYEDGCWVRMDFLLEVVWVSDVCDEIEVCLNVELVKVCDVWVYELLCEDVFVLLDLICIHISFVFIYIE